MSPFRWRWWRLAFSRWSESPGGIVVFPGYETWEHIGRGIWWRAGRSGRTRT